MWRQESSSKLSLSSNCHLKAFKSDLQNVEIEDCRQRRQIRTPPA